MAKPPQPSQRRHRRGGLTVKLTSQERAEILAQSAVESAASAEQNEQSSAMIAPHPDFNPELLHATDVAHEEYDHSGLQNMLDLLEAEMQEGPVDDNTTPDFRQAGPEDGVSVRDFAYKYLNQVCRLSKLLTQDTKLTCSNQPRPDISRSSHQA